MKVLTDIGRSFSPDEVAWGMARYGVWDGESTIDTDNDLQALAKRHDLIRKMLSQSSLSETQKRKR